MKKNLILGLIIILTIVCIGVGASSYFYHSKKNREQDNYKYIISYFIDYEPGANYKIYIDNDFNIKVDKTPGCSTKECLEGTKKPETKTYNITLNESNKNNLKKYISQLYAGKKDKELNLGALDFKTKEYRVFSSLVNDNAKRLELEIEPYLYRIIYGYGYQTTYYIYVTEDNNLKIKELTTVRDFEPSTIKTWELNFSSSNQNIIIDYLKNKVTESGTTELNINKPIGNDLIVLQSIIKNSEDLLARLNTHELLFTLSKNETEAYIYNDNTFICYYVTGKEYNTFSNGTLKINAQDILNNINDYKVESSNIILNTPKKELYHLDSNNETIIDLTNSIPNFGNILAVD